MDSFGTAKNLEKCSGQKMTMIRMQVKDIVSNGENLGSVLYAQSFVMVDENSVYINVTKNIPNLQAWFTNIGHHEHMPLEINTMKNLECD